MFVRACLIPEIKKQTQKQNSDIRMSTIDNPETQTIKLQKIKRKKTILQIEEQTKSQNGKFLKIQEHQ